MLFNIPYAAASPTEFGFVDDVVAVIAVESLVPFDLAAMVHAAQANLIISFTCDYSNQIREKFGFLVFIFEFVSKITKKKNL